MAAFLKGALSCYEFNCVVLLHVPYIGFMTTAPYKTKEFFIPSTNMLV